MELDSLCEWRAGQSSATGLESSAAALDNATGPEPVLGALCGDPILGISACFPQPMKIDQGIADLSNSSGCGFTLSHHRGICVTRFPGNVSGLESGVMEVERGLLVELLGSPRCGFALTGPDRPSKYVKLCLPNSGCTRNDTDPRLKLGFRGWISVRLCMQGGIDGRVSGDPTRSHMMHKTWKT